jgi:hypothetical protein
MRHLNFILYTLYFNQNHNHNQQPHQYQLRQEGNNRDYTQSPRKYVRKIRFGSPLKVDAPIFNHSYNHISTALGSLTRPQGKGQECYTLNPNVYEKSKRM